MNALQLQDSTPKAFVSHASEDKGRFVLDFATRLRENGIDAWVDKWEIGPGDSLIDKIFEEGLKNADAIVVVLSRASVTKKWVREELNAGVVKRINDSAKLIPVLIDDCGVPESLKSTVWVRIKDVKNYETELRQIVMAIYGHRDKPPLGSPPKYVQTKIDAVPRLTRIDSLALKIACEEAIESNQSTIMAGNVVSRAAALDVQADEISDALEILDAKGYIDGKRPSRYAPIGFLEITPYGFSEYGKVYLPDYNDLINAVAARIVNAGEVGNQEITRAVGRPQILVDYALDVLRSAGMIQVAKTLGSERPAQVTSVSPELKRQLQ